MSARDQGIRAAAAGLQPGAGLRRGASSTPAIRVEGLGKEYVIGSRERVPRTFREMLGGALSAPLRRLRRLRGDVGNEERFWALQDVSFEIAPGEVVGIIGRNGAGKSTLLKILSRITEPTRGRVEIRGRVSSLLEVGTGFHPELTGRENVYLNGAILGMTRREIDRKFDEIVAFADIEKFLDTAVKFYSSGMYVRLAFAVAAHLEPEVLVVDEVLAVGDIEFQRKCLGKMEDVATMSGRTVLFVSHNMAAVQTICKKAIWLDSGRLVSQGDVDSQIRDYVRASAADGVRKAGKTKATLYPGVVLSEFHCKPSAIESGSSLDIVIRLDVQDNAVRISDLTIVIYSETGVRVSILDLRSSIGVVTVHKRSCLGMRVEIPAFNLVEGVYYFGLFSNINGNARDLTDLEMLTVVEQPSSKDIPPYPVAYRGVLNLPFFVTTTV